VVNEILSWIWNARNILFQIIFGLE
jgi:hypothetical protein